MASPVNPQDLNFILTPLHGASVSTPLTDLGILLALRRVNVTIITIKDNAVRYKPSIDLANATHRLNIRLLCLDPPGEQASEKMRREVLERLMLELKPPPSCIVSSSTRGYTNDIAGKFRIPCYIFNARSCFSTICSIKILSNKLHTTGLTETFLVPGIPHKVELKGYQSPYYGRFCKENQTRETQKGENPVRGTEKFNLYQGMLINSFEEIEPLYSGPLKQKSLFWCIGPVSLCHKEILHKSCRSLKASIDADHCVTWLDSMKQGSVIYACFGSMSCIHPFQLAEIGLGLESSNQPFIWVIRDNVHLDVIERWLETTKFEKRVEGRGLVIRGWAPQLVILSHPSIGGFLTHCGWNSTLEGVCAGVPMITWPLFEEQHLNEKYVTDILGIGLSIFVEARVSSEAVIIKRDRVKEAIRELMNGEKAGEMRRRARKLGEVANKSVEKGGSSHSNITKFIQDVVNLLKLKQTNPTAYQNVFIRSPRPS